MTKLKRFLLAFSLLLIIPGAVFAEAPVVDESDNFNLLEAQEDAEERPLARAQIDTQADNEDYAVARDSAAPSHHEQSDNAMLLDKLKGLQQEVQELRGQLEIQSHELTLLKDQQLALYKDLDARLPGSSASLTKPNKPGLELTTTPSSPTMASNTSQNAVQPMVTPIPAARKNPAEEQISYLAAYELVKNKQYGDALVAMQTFIHHYPQSGYAANAEYWLGELYLVKKDYSSAIQHFTTVVQHYPSSSKSAASLLKIGYAYASSGNRGEARRYLQQVVREYPDTNTSQLAAAKLETLES